MRMAKLMSTPLLLLSLSQYLHPFVMSRRRWLCQLPMLFPSCSLLRPALVPMQPPARPLTPRLTSLDKALVNLWVRGYVTCFCLFSSSLYSHSIQQSNVLRMQIAHRKTQTDHKMLSDRIDALAARVDAVQADLHGAMRGDGEVDALRYWVQAAEDLLSQLQGRLSATEVALVDAKVQAEAGPCGEPVQT